MLTCLIDQQVLYGDLSAAGSREVEGVISFVDEVLDVHPAGGILPEALLEVGAIVPAGLAVVCVEGLVQNDLQMQ